MTSPVHMASKTHCTGRDRINRFASPIIANSRALPFGISRCDASGSTDSWYASMSSGAPWKGENAEANAWAKSRSCKEYFCERFCKRANCHAPTVSSESGSESYTLRIILTASISHRAARELASEYAEGVPCCCKKCIRHTSRLL